MNFKKETNGRCYKTFFGGNLYFPLNKNRKLAILKAINRFRVYFCLKKLCFHIFVQVRHHIFLYFLILGKSRK